MNEVRPREKFAHPGVTAKGETRAAVPLTRLRTLWFNTGSLCNIACLRCYMGSGPRDDRLAYLTAAEVARFVDEAQALDGGLREVGFTGGEPFMNPALPEMLDDVLRRGLKALVLTNAMAPLWTRKDAVRALRERHGAGLTLRVSLDHHTPERHDAERGAGAWEKTLRSLSWLRDAGVSLGVAGRTLWGEAEAEARAGYGALFAALGLAVDADDPAALVLFPEMDPGRDTPEITTACWGLLNKSPDDVMCAASRMVIKPRDGDAPVVAACTLLPYDERFILGRTLAEATGAVPLNHPYCSAFCVLGGGACSVG